MSEKEFNKDDSYKNLERINYWISNGDTKASFILAFIGVLITILFSSDLFTKLIKLDLIVKNLSIDFIITILSIFSILGFIIFAIYTIITIRYLFKVFTAKIKTEEFSQSELETNSVLFFGSIATKQYKEFKQDLENIDSNKLQNDINSQTYINSKICDLKFINYNLAIKNLKYSLIILIISLTINFILTSIAST